MEGLTTFLDSIPVIGVLFQAIGYLKGEWGAEVTVRVPGGQVGTFINLVPLDAGRLGPLADLAEIERVIAERMVLPFILSKIAANRMSVTWTDGLILNIATLNGPAKGARQAFASVARTGLVAMTRAQAEEWAGRAIRFNAIAPQTSLVPTEPALCGEPDIAALALYLASGRGKTLSGCVFEAQMH